MEFFDGEMICLPEFMPLFAVLYINEIICRIMIHTNDNLEIDVGIKDIKGDFIKEDNAKNIR